jgi:succinyl-CoA synthetase alpha subunit
MYPGLVKAGVTPGKGGADTGLPCPVFNTVKEAVNDATVGASINTGLIYVPPASVLDAALELMDNGIKLLYIVTEHTPIRDSIVIRKTAVEKGCVVVGGTSLGCIVPKVGRIGAIGGKKPEIAFKEGGLVILSKSGGLTPTTAEMFMRRGWGTYMAMGLGGDIIANCIYSDILPEMEKDPEVKAVVMLGEPGGSYEEQAAQCVADGKFTKPLVAYIAGKFQESMPEGMSFGHAGAIVERGMGKASDKINKLREAGDNVRVADYYHELIDCMEELNVPRDFEDPFAGGVIPPISSTL